MSHKHHNSQPPTEPTPDETAAVGTAETTPTDTGSELEQLRNKAAENLEGWQRSVAEFQNYKKRLERDRETERADMKSSIFKKVLPVLDDLDRALLNRHADDAWANGIELIQRKLRSTLESEGVQRIEAERAAFDPIFHEAVTHEDSADVPSGHVIEVLQNGYTLEDKVIRPAMVRVAK